MKNIRKILREVIGWGLVLWPVIFFIVFIIKLSMEANNWSLVILLGAAVSMLAGTITLGGGW